MSEYFDLKVGFTCNNNCVHCVVTGKKQTHDLKTHEIKAIIDSVDPKLTIGFTGGEATIRKDFIELLKYAKETGHSTALQTNGTMFYKEEFTREVAKYLDTCLLAIHSHIAEVHNQIVDCPPSRNMYERTIEGFKNVIKYKIPVRTQTVISKLNIEHLCETYDFIQEIAPNNSMSMTYPHPNGNAYYNHDIVVPRYSDIKSYLHKALSKYAHLLSVEAIPMCYLYPYHDKVQHNYDEDVINPGIPTQGLDPSNSQGLQYFDKDGRTDNYQASMRNDKRKGSMCAECSFNDKCAGVWKEYIEFYGDNLDFVPIKKEERKVNTDPGAIIIYSSNKGCMNTCNFCSGQHDNKTDDERWSLFVKEASYFIKNNYSTIEISGSDPGEYNRIDEVIKYLRSNGITKIQLSTHGRTLADESFVKQLANNGLTHCRIPLYGSNAEIHGKTVGNIEAFDDTVKAIENCVRAGIKICGHTIINNHNKLDINKIIRLYRDATHGYMENMVVSVAYIAQLTKDYVGDWYIPIHQLGPYVKDILHNRPKLPNNINFMMIDVPYCVVGKDYPEITNSLNPPNLGYKKVEKVNRSDEDDGIPHYRIKTYFSECDNCDLKHKCGGITVNEMKMFGFGTLKAVKLNQTESKSDSVEFTDDAGLDNSQTESCEVEFTDDVGLDNSQTESCEVEFIDDVAIEERDQENRELKLLVGRIIFLANKQTLEPGSDAEIESIIESAYKIVRTEPARVETIYQLMQNLGNIIVLINPDDPKIFNSLLSVIALKNDIRLQQYLNPGQVDLYLDELKFIINKKYYLSDITASMKLLDCLTKVQYAFNLLLCKVSVKDIYQDVVVSIHETFTEEFISTAKRGQYLTYMYLNLVMFSDSHNIEDTVNKQALLANWKGGKIKHYTLTYDDIIAEGTESYDLVYI